MQEMLGAAVGDYYGALVVGFRRAKFVGFMIVAMWMAYPTAVQTVIFPFDAINFMAWIQGQPVRHVATSQALLAGEFTALLGLLCLSLFQLGAMVVFYRRAQFAVTVWPLAVVLIGFIDNGIWWQATGHFDLEGALAGFTPMVLSVVCQGLCERMSKDFVFGPGNRPLFQPGMG
jgi:hypothetical protein